MKNIGPLKSITKIYSKLSNFGKILIFIALLLIIVVFFKSIEIPGLNKEGFQSQDKFLFKTGVDVYDEFYANIYDYLVFNNKNKTIVFKNENTKIIDGNYVFPKSNIFADI